MIRFIY